MSQLPESSSSGAPGPSESSAAPAAFSAPATSSAPEAAPAPSPFREASPARSPVPLPEPRTRSESSLGWWLAGGMVLLPCLAAVLVIGVNKFNHSDAPAGEVGEQAAPAKSDVATAGAAASGAAQRLASLPAEERPPVGDWQTLSPGQMRYCATQKLRLKTVVTLVRTDKPTEVDIYNSRLADYKARCQNMGNTPEEYVVIQDAVQTDLPAIERAAKADWTATLAHGPVTAPIAAPSPAPAVSAPASAASNGVPIGDQANTVSAPKVTESARPAAFPLDTGRSDQVTKPTVPTASSAGESAPRAATSPPAAVPAAPTVKADPSAGDTTDANTPAAAPQPKPKRQPPAQPKQLEWCVEGRCARL